MKNTESNRIEKESKKWQNRKSKNLGGRRKEGNNKNGKKWIKNINVKYSLADNMGQGEGPTVPLQSDAPEESDLWTAWQLFPLDDDHICHSKDGGSDTSRSPDIGRNCGGVSISPRGSLKVI